VAVARSLADQTVASDAAAFNAWKPFGGSAVQALAAEKGAAAGESTSVTYASLIKAKAVASSTSSSSSSIMEYGWV
jgi:hypothetical protein